MFWGRPDTSSVLQVKEQDNECLLIKNAQAGNQYAFEALYERYNDRICRYLIRMVGDDGIGCELTQETFLKVWESLPGLREPEHFNNWLYRIATNCAYTYQNKAKRLRLLSWGSHDAQLENLSIAGPEEKIEETELLKLALAQVSSTYRPYVILYVIEEMPQRQIAELMKIKETSVSKYVSRGKEELRQIYYRLMKEQEHTPEKRRRKR